MKPTTKDYQRMKIKQLIENKDLLENVYQSYIKRELILKSNLNLSKAHISKADYDMEFADFILKEEKFASWSVVGLYYSLYHTALALLSKKGYYSKDYNATLCFLIKHYSEFSKEEIELVDNLKINREEIEFYSGLKEERRKASYSTDILFKRENVEELRKQAISFLNKAKTILNN